ncbi:Oidioi.mRNA.OKI2018_I69.chr1.g3888.t1.cds [Oikopleura dioica]|uniref:Oidioi.mRNA.OKI2018_I69.chr1.g3888.t1.cds n=1 Tax=Oikopleura dioica TaxID=34765 RepID=A0ABN7SV91_OIKDI|nr:Oidioi.mRNA.OKI2018_I69.chr1.g3888.t1.cds [Oikopleura dioica]
MSSTDELAKFNSLTKEERLMSSTRIRAKYPQKVPIVLHRSAGNTAVPELNRFRYLVPSDLRVSELITVIRRNIKDPKFDESKALF